MSTDAFAPAAFPRLRAPGAGDDHDRARRQGFAAGHAEGYRAGLVEAEAQAAREVAMRAERDAAAREEIDAALRAVGAAADALHARTAELTASDERRLLANAIQLAEMILTGELRDGETSAQAAVRRALAAHDPRESREVRVSAADLRTLESLGVLPAAVTLVADDALASGDAVVRLDDGVIDARIAAALARARRAIDEQAP